MREATGPWKAAARRTAIPTGAALVALLVALAGPSRADDPPVFQPGAGLSAEDHQRIGAGVLFLGGVPTGGEVYGELSLMAAGEAVRLWPAAPPERRIEDGNAQVAIGAGSLYLNGFGGGAAGPTDFAYLAAGQDLRFWTYYNPDIVRQIPPWELEVIRDKTSIPKDPEDRELDAYFDMIIYANRTSPAALDRAAVRDDDLWTKVFHDPDKYRGQLLHFEGRLKKLRQFPAQAMAAQGGATSYYEGYLSVDPWDNNPLFFICTELPAGLKPADKMDVPAGVTGYFYKLFRYEPEDKKKTGKDRQAPVVIGHTITVAGAPTATAPEDSSGPSWWPEWLGPLAFGIVALAVALLFTVGYWFRGGDRRVRNRLFAARHGEFVPPPPDAPPDPRERPRNGGPQVN